ncbi:hypothetical protein [Streptomyces sp. NPDC056632]|uniref:hypothetical protein n=1 Tax=Streptomyces sp. NPDC056632 TaxID=3345884 RepID=UPI00367453DC
MSRRATLMAAVGSALALSPLRSPAAHAAAPLSPGLPRRPYVTNPREAGAVYDAPTATRRYAEPLNAAVDCANATGRLS